MSKSLSPQEALHKAAAYCSSGEQCCHDIFEKLKKWGIENSEASEIIEYLIKQRFIDEARYAKGFTNDKFRFNKWGRIKIAYALRQKKIPEILIDETLHNIDEEQYRDTLLQILGNKKKNIKASDKYDLHAKLFRFAASRGFEPDIIQSVIQSMKL